MKKILSIIALSFLLVGGVSAQEVCTITDQSVTENVCHTETVQDTSLVCHNEFSIWDVFHWFPREVCENVVTSRELEICTPITTTIPVTTCETIPDTTKPVITIIGNNPFEQKYGSPFIDPGASATDDEDGDISGQICSAGNVDTGKPGKYVITYDVSDSAGNAADQASREVNVVGGGAVRIFYIPEIKDYSFKKISANIYEFHFVGKNMDLIRQRPKIKWGKDIDDVSFAAWEDYAEVKDIYIPDGQNSIIFWVRNSDSTGRVLSVNLMTESEYKGD